MRRKCIAGSRRNVSRPTPEGVGAGPSQPRTPFGATHARLKVLGADGTPVVVHKDDEGIVGNSPFVDLVQQCSDVLIDVVDHPEEVLELGIKTVLGVKCCVLAAGNVGIVRCIGSDPAKEGLLASLLVHPLRCLTKEDIGAIAVRLHEPSVMENERIEVLVSRSVPTTAGITLSDTTTPMDEDFFKTSAVRSIRFFVPKMPLAKNSGRVTGVLQDLCKRNRTERHSFSLENRVCDSIQELMPTGHQRGSGRCTGWRDKELGQRPAFTFQSVEVRSSKGWIPMRRQVTITLIVGQHDDDVRRGGV